MMHHLGKQRREKHEWAGESFGGKKKDKESNCVGGSVFFGEQQSTKDSSEKKNLITNGWETGGFVQGK